MKTIKRKESISFYKKNHSVELEKKIKIRFE